MKSISFSSFMALGLSVCSIMPMVNAAENDLDLAVTQNFIWDSNPLNSVTNDFNIYGSETRALLSIERMAKNLEWDADFTVLHDEFDDSDFNSTDFYFDTEFSWATPTSELAFIGGYDYDTTRDEENTQLGTDITADRRESWTIAPQYTHYITERFSLSLNGNWQETRYDANGLTDFRTISLSPSMIYGFSPLQSASLGLQARRYEPLDLDGRKVESIGPVIGWNYNFHPKFSVSLSGGYLGTEFKGYTNIDDDRRYNPIYSATLSYMGSNNQAFLTYDRSRQGFADGTEADQTTIRLDNKNRLNDLLSLNVMAMYQNAERDTSTAAGFESAVAQSVSVNYKLGQRWSLSLAQKYRQEEYANLNDDAKRHTVRIGLTYNLNDVY